MSQILPKVIDVIVASRIRGTRYGFAVSVRQVPVTALITFFAHVAEEFEELWRGAGDFGSVIAIGVHIHFGFHVPPQAVAPPRNSHSEQVFSQVVRSELTSISHQPVLLTLDLYLNSPRVWAVCDLSFVW